MAEFVAATQGLVIAAIMPRVVADLHGLGAYSLAFGSLFAAFLLFSPFAGPWADRYGTRAMLAIALGVLALGLGLVAVAPNMTAFVGARFVEGIGDGIDYAVSFAIVAKTFPEPLRARMLSLTSAAWVVPAIVGPGLGAYVASVFGWRWAFAGFLPLIAVAAALVLPALDSRPAPQRGDVFGALRLLFSRATLRANAGLHASFVALGLLHAAFFGADAYVALMLTSVRGLSLQLSSVCITLGAVGWSVAAIFAPALLGRLGKARVVFWGATSCLLGALGLLGVALGAALPLAFVACLASGAGIGLAYPTLSVVAFGFAREGDEGVVSSAALLAAIVGIIAGVLACGVSVSVAARSGAPLQVALVYTFAVAAACALALGALARRINPEPVRVRTSP
ncbi:MAG: MFS transporter [Candidatus Tumulicola sp.]